MRYLALLREQLKSDSMLDLLETYDMEVIYSFDRTYENLPDAYWTKCLELGLELRFDADQCLKTIFIYITDADDFTPADLSNSDVIQFDSKAEAASYALKNGISAHEGCGEFFGEERDWIRLEYDNHSVHYEYRRGSLALVTLTAT